MKNYYLIIDNGDILILQAEYLAENHSAHHKRITTNGFDKALTFKLEKYGHIRLQ